MADAKAAKKDDKAEEKPADGTAPAEGAEGADDAAKKKKKKMMIIIGAVVLVLLLAGGGAAAYFLILKPKDGEGLNCESVKEGDENYAACAEQLAKSVTGSTPGVFVSVPDMVVNLSGTGSKPRFLKVVLKIELEKAEQQAAFEAILPRTIDQFQTYLRELRVEDLRGSSGIYRMKIELLNRVRAAAPDLTIKDVLFQEILIQ